MALISSRGDVSPGETPAAGRAVPGSGETVDFFRHGLGEAELTAVAEVLRGAILTTGDTVERFEQRFADYLGRGHCVGLTSCTGALHLALIALGVGPGDEVITTPMTFIASATAVLQAGATPVFVDVEQGSANIDATAIEAAITPRTRAILPVHLYGQMCDMRRIRAIADRHGLLVGTGDGSLLLREVQLEGKRRMTAREFLQSFDHIINQKQTLSDQALQVFIARDSGAPRDGGHRAAR